jgi:hypothetical protein
MARVTLYDTWIIDASRLPSGVAEATERRLIDTIEFDADQMHFTEALLDAGWTAHATCSWHTGRTVDGRTEHTVMVDGWPMYLAVVVEERVLAVSLEVAA